MALPQIALSLLGKTNFEALGKLAATYYFTGFGGFAKQGVEIAMSKIQKAFGDVVNLGAEDFGLFGSIKYWDRIYNDIGRTSQQLGIAGDMSVNMRDSMQEAYEIGVAYGLSIEQLNQAYSSLIREMGVNRLISKEDLNLLAEFTENFGEGFTQIFATLSLYGASIEDVQRITMEAVKEADELGLNASEYLKTLSQNMGVLDRFSFRRGIDGLSRMVELSQRYKINIESAAGFAERNLMLNDIMETSARLQVLGGQFSQLADPFELGFMVRNDIDALTEKVIDLAGAYAMIDEKGKAIIDPFGMDMIREFSSITGIQTEQIAAAAKIRAIRDEIGGQLSSELKQLDDYNNYLEKIAANAFFDETMGEYVVNVKVGDEIKKIATVDLNKDQVDSLSAIGKNTNIEDINKQLILTNESLGDTMQRLIDTFKRYVISENLYRLTADQIRPMAQELRTGMNDNSFANITKTLYDSLDESIFNQLMERIDDAGDLTGFIGDYMTEQGLGLDLKGLKNSLDGLLYTLNNPIDAIKNKIYESGGIGETFIKSWDYLDVIDGLMSGPMSPYNTTLELQKWNEKYGEKPIDIKTKDLGVNNQKLLTMIKEKKNVIDTDGVKNEISFKEFKGSITIKDESGRKLSEIEMKNIWKDIEPKFKEMFTRQINDEVENNNKYNSKPQKIQF